MVVIADRALPLPRSTLFATHAGKPRRRIQVLLLVLPARIRAHSRKSKAAVPTCATPLFPSVDH